MNFTYQWISFFGICVSIFIAGCAYQSPPISKQDSISKPPLAEFINILGSSRGNYADRIDVIRDVKVSNLRIRQTRERDSKKCKIGYRDRLELDGEIGPDSTFIIDKMLTELPVCTDANGTNYSPSVFLNSGGGLLNDGYKLGGIFRKHEVGVYVIEGQVCASACAIAFLGGKYRTMLQTGKLIFHSPYREGAFEIVCASKMEAIELKKYLNDMLSNNSRNDARGLVLFERTMSYCSSSNGWTINGDAAALYGITT